jgi:hypothetical protein
MSNPKRNNNWRNHIGGTTSSNSEATVSLLWDIREELRELNRLLNCRNFQRMPTDLHSIADASKQINKRLAKRIKLK